MEWSDVFPSSPRYARHKCDFFVYFRYLELESSGRKNEIRLYYYPHPPGYHDNARHIHTQTFPYHFADGNWHKLAISISTHFIQLFIDCQKVYERQISSLDTSHLSKHRNIRLWLGQRSADQAHFKVTNFTQFYSLSFHIHCYSKIV